MAPTGPFTWKHIEIFNGTAASGFTDRVGGAIDINSGKDDDKVVVVVGAPYRPDPNATGYADAMRNSIIIDQEQAWQRIPGPQEARGEHFGSGVSLSDDGNVLLVSARNLVQVYQFNSGEWILNKTIRKTLFRGDEPTSVTLSGNGQFMAVASSTSGVGYVQVFDLFPSHPTLDIQLRGDANKTTISPVNWLFGYSLGRSRDGGTFVVASGSFIWVCRFGFYSWRQCWSLLDGMETTRVSISDDGNEIAIGTRRNSGLTGEIAMFGYYNGTWNQLGQILEGGPAEFWGKRSVLLSGDGTVAAATPLDQSSFSSGSFRIFQYSEPDNEWEALDSIGYEDNDFNPFFCSLSFSGTWAVCSDIWSAEIPGSARVYRLDRSRES